MDSHNKDSASNIKLEKMKKIIDALDSALESGVFHKHSDIPEQREKKSYIGKKKIESDIIKDRGIDKASIDSRDITESGEQKKVKSIVDKSVSKDIKLPDYLRGSDKKDTIDVKPLTEKVFNGLSGGTEEDIRTNVGFVHVSKIELKKESEKSRKKGKPRTIKDLEEEEQRRIILERLNKIKKRSSFIKIRTQADLVLEILEKTGESTITEIAEKIGVNIDKMEHWCKIFEKNGLLRIKYPVNPLEVPKLYSSQITIDPARILHFYLDNDFKKDKTKKLLKEYTIHADLLPITIRLWRVSSKYSLIYEIDYPDIGLGTFAILESLKEEIASRLKISGEDVMDHEKLMALKKRYLSESYDLVDEVFPYVDEVTKKLLSVILVHISFGLGVLEVFLSDPNLEEIVVNTSKYPVTAYHKDFYWIQSNAYMADESVIYNYASQMGRKAGRQLTSLNPLMDAHLPTGERVNATISPVSNVGNTITLRKQSSRALSPLHFVGPNIKFRIYNFDIGALLWTCMQNEMNIMVVGGTASGKTSMLNSLLTFLPTNQHVVTIEDTRELTLPKFMEWNWIPLTTRPPTPEGKGEVTMLDLLMNALRMRPDRIILGEVRRAAEAQTMFEAMHTGHAAYATFHANTAEAAFRRLTEEPINIPELEISALHLFVVQNRNRLTGWRRTYEVVEVFPTKSGVMLQHLYKWNAINDEFVKKNESKRIYSDLTASTGMTTREIESDLEDKKTILKWLHKHDIREVTDVGMIINQYYTDIKENTDFVIELAKKNSDPKIILNMFREQFYEKER